MICFIYKQIVSMIKTRIATIDEPRACFTFQKKRSHPKIIVVWASLFYTCPLHEKLGANFNGFAVALVTRWLCRDGLVLV